MTSNNGSSDATPTHISGVVIAHKDTPNPTQTRTLVNILINQDGRQYLSLAQSRDDKSKIVIFTEDWEFLKKQVEELIAKKRLLK